MAVWESICSYLKLVRKIDQGECWDKGVRWGKGVFERWLWGVRRASRQIIVQIALFNYPWSFNWAFLNWYLCCLLVTLLFLDLNLMYQFLNLYITKQHIILDLWVSYINFCFKYTFVLYYMNFTSLWAYLFSVREPISPTWVLLRLVFCPCCGYLMFALNLLQLRLVHVCGKTLSKRLIEFENTESGSLTVCFRKHFVTFLAPAIQNMKV